MNLQPISMLQHFSGSSGMVITLIKSYCYREVPNVKIYSLVHSELEKQFKILKKSSFTGNILPCDKQVNIMGSFVRNDRFKVHHMSHKRKITGNPHGTDYLTGFARNIKRHLYIITFCHGDLGR